MYETGEIDFISMSSVGPGYFVIIEDKFVEKYCSKFEALNLDVIHTSPFNSSYKIKKTTI